MERITLDQLPAELLLSICELLGFQTLVDLSKVNRTLRTVCIPYIFNRLTVEFSLESFQSLAEFATETHLARHVKTLDYEVWGFPNAIFSTESAFSQSFTPTRNFAWERLGRNLRYQHLYPPLHEYYSEIHALEASDIDTTLVKCMPAFPNLRKVSFEYQLLKNGASEQMEMLFDIVDHFVTDGFDHGEALGRHFGVLFAAMNAAVRPIESLEVLLSIDTFYAKVDFELEEGELGVAQRAFDHIKELEVQDYNEFLQFLVFSVQLPVLQQLRVGDFNPIDLDLVRRVCRKASPTLRALHLATRDIVNNSRGPWVGAHELGSYMVVAILHDIAQRCTLEEVSIELRPAGGGIPTSPEVLRGLERLLLRQATMDEVDTIIEEV